ncbi:MAG: HAD family hydrolase [Spirochaetales bacterium]|nr:HAD family hydrolase [Spirochaetales bacterium]
MRPLKRGIVFDLDGTLLNTTKDIGLAIGRTLEHEFTDSQINRFVGRGLKNAIINASAEIGFRFDDADALLQRLLNFYRQVPVRYTRPYPGVTGFLQDLNRANIPVCVYSNKEQDIAESVLKISFPNITFAQITGMNGKYEMKPSSQAIEAFSKLVKIPVSDMLYVGDSEVDHLTAKAADMDYRILTWGMRTKEDLLGSGVPEEVLVSDIDQIRDLVL